VDFTNTVRGLVNSTPSTVQTAQQCQRFASRRVQNASHDLTWEGRHFGLYVFIFYLFMFTYSFIYSEICLHNVFTCLVMYLVIYLRVH
jgi:hypothetical protein